MDNNNTSQEAEVMGGAMAIAAPTGSDADHINTPQEAEGMVGAVAFAAPAGTDADHRCCR